MKNQGQILARMVLQGGKQERKKHFLKKRDWSTERLKDKFPSQTHEDAEDSINWRNPKQLEMNSQWKELCKEWKQPGKENWGKLASC